MLELYQNSKSEEETIPSSLAICSVVAEASHDMVGDAPMLTNSEAFQNIQKKLSHLTPGEQADIRKLLLEFRHLFPDVPSCTNCIYHDVDLGNAAPCKQHPYRVNPIKLQYLQKEIDYILKNNIIEPSSSEWSSPCVLVPKLDGTFQFCTDFRKLNAVTRADSYPMPRIEDCIDQVGKAKYVTTFDLLKGYWQIPLTERAKKLSAFMTPKGLYQYRVKPFGMQNMPATFQRMINQIVGGIEGCEAYIDDVIAHSDSWQGHISQLRALLSRFSEANLTINLSKSEFGHGEVTFLGHTVGNGQVKPVNAKVQSVVSYPTPKSR